MFDNLPIDVDSINLVSISIRLLLAIIIGGIIGTERDYKNQAAGIRTHMLVSMGAAIIMMTNQYIFEMYPEANIDITRMGAQVVSGIGFLGAGTILVTNNNRVRGLTTAAGLWAAAAIGLAIGIGFYEMAILGGIGLIVVMSMLYPFKQFIQDKAEVDEVALIIYTRNDFDGLIDFINNSDAKIADMNVVDDFDADSKHHVNILKITLSINNNFDLDEFLDEIKVLENVSHVIEI